MKKIVVLLSKEEYDIIKKIPTMSIYEILFCIYNKRHFKITVMGGCYYAD